jgi:hypothetical protein
MKHNQNHQTQTHTPAPAPRPVSAAKRDINEINFLPSADEVARQAYFSYENQGALPGHDVQHWLAAEADLIAERNLTRTHQFHNHN